MRLRVFSRLAAGAGLLVVAPLVHVAGAQVVRGTVRDAATSLPVQAVTLTARDSLGGVLATSVTDSSGRYALRVRVDRPFELRVRRLGFEMQSIPLSPRADTDTLDVEILLHEVAAAAAAVTVTASSSLNEQRLTEARRRGWRVYEPALVAQHREQAQDLGQLLRSISAAGLVMPRSRNDCFRSVRNNQCMTLVLDGQVLGPVAVVLPSDLYFLAVLSATDARLQFGDRAPWGAIALYTRSRIDRPPRRRPPD